MKKSVIICSLLSLAFHGLAVGGVTVRKITLKGGTMPLAVVSSAFKNNGLIPAKYACGGENVSPPLSWSGLPAGAKSVALIMDDPDAPGGTWIHWILFDMPPSSGGLKENTPKTATLPDGSRLGAAWCGENDSSGKPGYFGPCPPPGKPHRYFFKVYALDKVLGLPAGTPKKVLLKAMSGHVLAQGELTGLYKR